MPNIGLRWRFFWSRRSSGRMTLALACAVLALLPAIFLALPVNSQQAILRTVAATAQAAGPTGLQVILEVLLVIFAWGSFTLLLAPGYRQFRYLTIPTSLIAPITVYVDAENLLSEQDIPSMVAFLRKFLDGRRADLLFFMDAERGASSKKYKALYRFGFRPFDVPHNPTGEKVMGEAVDRELAMHAFERALLGPPRQEFIVISSDADFAPLVYRLTELGHSVQIWSSTSVNAYRSLSRYVPLTLVDLSQVLSEQSIEEPGDELTPATRTQETNKKRKSRKRPSGSAIFAQVTPPVHLVAPGQEKLYYAIAATLSARRYCEDQYTRDSSRHGAFQQLLTSGLAPRIASVGYSAGSWVDYWRDHLEASSLLAKTPGADFPSAGKVSAEAGTRELYAMAQACADAAIHAISNRPDGLLNMQVILPEVEAAAAVHDASQALRALVAAENGRRATHMRYFLRCARALGLIQFDDVRSSLDLIANPRVVRLDELGPDSEARGDNSASDSV